MDTRRSQSTFTNIYPLDQNNAEIFEWPKKNTLELSHKGMTWTALWKMLSQSVDGSSYNVTRVYVVLVSMSYEV